MRAPADGFADERRHIDGFGRLLRRAAGVVEKLAHDRIHLDQIGDHRRTGFGGQLSHFELEPQSRQRRAQVMRDSRQQHGAVCLQLAQVGDHAIETFVDGPDLDGTGGRQWLPESVPGRAVRPQR